MGGGAFSGASPFSSFGFGMEDDDEMGFSTPHSRPTKRHQPQPHSTTVKLGLTLEELFTGCVKKLKVTKQRNGQPASTVLEVAVKPGWKAGTKVTFRGEGDELPGQPAADIVFEVTEKPHGVFERQNNDLVIKRNVTLTQALCGYRGTILGLDGRQIEVDCSNDVITPGFQKRIRGQGMPITKQLPERGDMIVNFNVVFPQSLSAEQKRRITDAHL